MRRVLIIGLCVERNQCLFIFIYISCGNKYRRMNEGMNEGRNDWKYGLPFVCSTIFIIILREIIKGYSNYLLFDKTTIIITLRISEIKTHKY